MLMLIIMLVVLCVLGLKVVSSVMVSMVRNKFFWWISKIFRLLDVLILYRCFINLGVNSIVVGILCMVKVRMS